MSRDDMVRLPKKWPSENWESAWVPGIQVDNTIYVSGITSTSVDGEVIGIGDFKAQATRCLEKLQDVLGRAGASMDDVVKLTTYLTPQVDMAEVADYFKIRAPFFGPHGPASTGVTVHSLRRKEFLIEIDAIAHCPRK